VAVPVSPQETVADLTREADRVVCLSQPGDFRALGYLLYLLFPPLSDSDVAAAMDEAIRSRKKPDSIEVRNTPLAMAQKPPQNQ